MFNNAPAMIAGGTIGPSRFCTPSAAADHTVLQSTAGAPSPFISQVGMKRPPGLPGSDNAIAAEAGDQIQLFALGDVCALTAGAAVTRGAFLKSDATGRGIAGAAGEETWALALESATAAGVLILVQLMHRALP